MKRDTEPLDRVTHLGRVACDAIERDPQSASDDAVILLIVNDDAKELGLVVHGISDRDTATVLAALVRLLREELAQGN